MAMSAWRLDEGAAAARHRVVGAVRARGGDSDTDADLQRECRERDRPWNLVHVAPRQPLGCVAAEGMVQKDAELVTAQPCNRAAFGEPDQALRDDAQHLIAQPMAVDVVDRLEIVEVDDEQRVGFTLGQQVHRLLEILDEPAAIEQTGKNIMARQLVRSLLGDTPLSDLTVQVPHAADREDLGGDAEKDEQDDGPVDRVAFRLVGEGEEFVERVVPDREQIERETYGTHHDKVARDPALPLEPGDEPVEGCRNVHDHRALGAPHAKLV
jgi:hypothetical protein